MSPVIAKWLVRGWLTFKWIFEVLLMCALILIAYNSGKYIGTHRHIHRNYYRVPPPITRQLVDREIVDIRNRVG